MDDRHTATADRFPDLPVGMRLLARDPRGYPVPWFVSRKAPPHDGGPDFRVMDDRRWKSAVRERRCWVCGLRLGGETGTFVAGPMCGVNRTSAEPPCHLACARASVRHCPFLSHPGRIRDERGLPANSCFVGGLGIKRNPGVTMLWTSGFEVWRPPSGGRLIAMGEPEAVEWWRMGRPATSSEVWESIESGIPLLREQCFTPDDHIALLAYVQRFGAYVPTEDA